MTPSNRLLVSEILVCCSFTLLAVSCRDKLDCEEADQQAAALLAEFGSCSEAQRCEVVPLGVALADANEVGVCIDAFICSVALREGAGRDAFIGRAREIVRRRDCPSCTAKCAVPEALEAFCDPQAKQCRLRAKPTM